jgi:hypothetical protein
VCVGKMRVLLDMDDVLCDFVGGAAWLWGATLRDLEPLWPREEWSMVPPLSRYVYGKSGRLQERDFWRRVTACGENFWTGLLPHPWLMELTDGVAALTADWHVVTSPSVVLCPASYSGKARWLMQHLPHVYKRGGYVPTMHKHLLANPFTVLVDDKPSNVEAFREAGGLGVLFPRHWNAEHPPAAEAVGHTLEALRHISEEVF